MENKNNHIVANGVRLELDDNNGDVYIVFKIIDPVFKKKIRESWLDDIELKVINKSLVQEK